MSKKLKLSPWHDVGELPFHNGPYEVDDDDGITGPWFSYFNGIFFCYRDTSPERAVMHKHMRTDCRKLTKWRGVLK